MSLIGVLRHNGIEAGLAIGKDKDLLKAVAIHRPSVVAFSCVTGIHGWALNMCRAIKTVIDPSITTLMGGAHPTFFPEVLETSSYLDIICLGEGELAILDLMRISGNPDQASEIPNLHVRSGGCINKNPVRPYIEDLDSLPFMDREWVYRHPILRDNPVKRLITGRGCPYNCSFCFNHSAKQLYKGKGSYIRKRSVESVLEEMARIRHHYPVKTFLFEDDLFGVNQEWLLRFCEEYPRRFDTPFICAMRADVVNRENVQALKSAGCFNVIIGMETGDEHLRNTLLRKNITNEQLMNAAALFHQADIRFCTTNILGLPGETVEQSIRTIEFNLALKPTFTWCSIFQPYPRTELGNYVVEQGLVERLDVDAIEPNYHSNSLLRQPDIHRSVNLHKFFYVIFNHPWFLPVARWLSRFPPNPLFTMIHRISFLLIYSRRWNISLSRAIQEGIRTSGFTRKVNSEGS